MQKQILFVILFFIVLACATETKEASNFTLNGEIAGLKKGTVYLQKIADSTFITVDSINVSGDSKFKMSYNLDEPEILFLRLNKNDNDESAISFFADTGITKINSTLKNFLYDAKIEGSNQQKLLEEYLMVMSRFNDNNLDLIKKSFETRATNDTIKITEVNEELDNLLKRKYLYTINFAFNHKNSEVSPYLAVSQIPDASTKFLDTIYNGLTEDIRNSKYGIKLKDLLDERKND